MSHIYCVCVYGPMYTVRSAVCVDGKRGVMRPGQTLMEHSALGVCYTTRCTHRFDSATGFYLIKASSINCTAQCQPVSTHRYAQLGTQAQRNP